MNALESILGPNWRTTLSGWIMVLAGAVVMEPALLDFLPPAVTKDLIGIAKLIVLVSGGAFAHAAKDKNVAGNGSAFEPYKVPDQFGSNRTIAPK